MRLEHPPHLSPREQRSVQLEVVADGGGLADDDGVQRLVRESYVVVGVVNPFAHRLMKRPWTAPTISRWTAPRALHSLARSAASLAALQAYPVSP